MATFRKPHLRKEQRDGSTYWVCTWVEFKGYGCSPQQAYSSLYYNVQTRRLGAGSLPAPLTPP